jgi:hypothetical protein
MPSFNRIMKWGAGQLAAPMLPVGGLAMGSPGILDSGTNANHTMTVDQMARGLITYNAFSAGRNVTTPSAAAILAANPDMDIGDVIMMLVSVETAFALTWVAGAGVTLNGKGGVVASGSAWVAVEKTGAAAVTWWTF